MSLIKTTSWNESIGVFNVFIYKEGRSWWLNIACNDTHVTLDEFPTKKAAIERLEDVRGLLNVATHEQANKLFDVQSNLPYGFVPGSIDRLSYSGVA